MWWLHDDGASGVGGGTVLPANLTVENHGEHHAENQQEGDGEGDSQHYLHVVLHQADDFGSAGLGVVAVQAALVSVGGGDVAATGTGEGPWAPLCLCVQETTALEICLQFLQVVSQRRILFEGCGQVLQTLVHPVIHLVLAHSSRDACCHQEDEDEEKEDEEQQQHAAVLSDGSTAAQEAQNHDDRTYGDHQVDAG